MAPNIIMHPVREADDASLAKAISASLADVVVTVVVPVAQPSYDKQLAEAIEESQRTHVSEELIRNKHAAAKELEVLRKRIQEQDDLEFALALDIQYNAR